MNGYTLLLICFCKGHLSKIFSLNVFFSSDLGKECSGVGRCTDGNAECSNDACACKTGHVDVGGVCKKCKSLLKYVYCSNSFAFLKVKYRSLF